MKEIEVIVTSVTPLAAGISAWEFRHPDGAELPPFTAGAHIDLLLPNGLRRSYSLCNNQDDRDRYVVAVSLDPASTGGSRFIHESLKPGDRLPIHPPINNFALNESAPHTVFFAGGIGITPIWSMIQRMESLGRSWELHYSTRQREVCAFKALLEDIEQKEPGRVHFNFDQELGGRMLDLKALIAASPEDAHLYCCGPKLMLDAFLSAAAFGERPQDHVHVEYFSPAHEAAREGGFVVELARSGGTYEIPEGVSILEVLLEEGIDLPFSCMEGTCGTCSVEVLEGVPDHRDSVLTPDERATNKRMMICCSGSKSAKLVLDT